MLNFSEILIHLLHICM